MEISCIRPNNKGWLESKLSDVELNYVWECINKRTEYKVNSHLAGDIYSSNGLIDEDDWFFDNVISKLILEYVNQFGSDESHIPTLLIHPYAMGTWWVNYQKQGDFNPVHNHSSMYSFVIWLKIPYTSEEQNKDNNSNADCRGAFEIIYNDILGKSQLYKYHLGREYEGTLLFFPASLRHAVYPFFNCDEERISVSGNIILDSRYEAFE